MPNRHHSPAGHRPMSEPASATGSSSSSLGNSTSSRNGGRGAKKGGGHATIRRGLLAVWMGIISGKQLCGCCWCLHPPEDVIPFWSKEDAEKASYRTQDSISDDNNVNSSINDSYSHEFDTATETQTQTRTQTQTVASVAAAKKGSHATTTPSAGAAAAGEASPGETRLSRLAKEKGLDLSGGPRSPKTPIVTRNGTTSGARRGESGSESEDSFSMTYSETPSDASDYEAKIKVLNEELKRRKLEAEGLKKEQKRRRKDRMKEQEASLKRQIKAYDEYISQVRTELTKDVDLEPVHSPVRPQIKQPAESRRLVKALSPPEVRSNSSGVDSDGAKDRSSISGTSSDMSASPITPDSPASPVRKTSGESSDDKKTSTPKETQAPRSLNHSEVSEDIPEESIYSETATSDKSELKLRLDDTDDEKIAAQTPRAAESARTLSEIQEEYTEPGESDVAGFTPRTPTGKAPLSARSETIQSQITEDFESEKSEASQSSKTYTYSSSSTKSVSKDSYSSKQSSHTESSEHSSSVTASTTRSESTGKSESIQREESRTAKTQESVHTEEDISEHFDEASDLEEEEERSGLTFDLKQDVIPEDPLSDFKIGDRVLVGGAQAGTLMFKGTTKFMPGYWGGIALDKAEGRNDGSKDGVAYFKCKPNHGIFAPPDKITHLGEMEDGKDTESSSSEHTLTEDVSNRPKDQSEEEEEEEDLDQISEPKPDSITEDISVATDSELERVISSAAAAVESFDDAEQQPQSDVTSEGVTSQEETPRPEEDRPRIPEDLTLVKDEAVEEEVESVVKTPPPVPARPDTKTKDNKLYADTTANNTVQDLLSEAISQMITIRNRKRDTSPDKAEEEDIKPKPVVEKKLDPFSLGPELGKVSDSVNALLDLPAKKPAPIEAALDFTFPEPSVTTQASGPATAGKDDLDRLYEDLEGLTGGEEDEFWEDMDLGLPAAHKPPPPYPEKSAADKSGVSKSEQKPDIRKLAEEELIYAVPHKEEEIRPLVDNVADVYWEKRRYGESWDDVEAPASYFTAEDRGSDMESRSKRVYKTLIFDLTGEILRDLYKEEDEGEELSWSQFKTKRTRPIKDRTPPTTLQQLKPILQNCVLKALKRPQQSKHHSHKVRAWGNSSRKKKDHVDQILVQELREEEPDWVNYDDDELAVKMQLADTLFDNLLSETTQLLGDIHSKRDGSHVVQS